jgi:hypothetical protein
MLHWYRLWSLRLHWHSLLNLLAFRATDRLAAGHWHRSITFEVPLDLQATTISGGLHRDLGAHILANHSRSRGRRSCRFRGGGTVWFVGSVGLA